MDDQDNNRRAADHDSPWKMALESYFEEFLGLLFPAINKQVDWSKGYSFIDNELQQITADAESGRRYADKLIKVYAKNGSETWVRPTSSQRQCFCPGGDGPSSRQADKRWRHAQRC